MWRLHLKTFMVPPPDMVSSCKMSGSSWKGLTCFTGRNLQGQIITSVPWRGGDVTCERRLTRTECAELSECELTELLQRCFDRSTIRPSVSREGRCPVCPGRGWDWNEASVRMTVSGNPLQHGLFFPSSEIIFLLSNVKECLCGPEWVT